MKLKVSLILLPLLSLFVIESFAYGRGFMKRVPNRAYKKVLLKSLSAMDDLDTICEGKSCYVGVVPNGEFEFNKKLYKMRSGKVKLIEKAELHLVTDPSKLIQISNFKIKSKKASVELIGSDQSPLSFEFRKTFWGWRITA